LTAEEFQEFLAFASARNFLQSTAADDRTAPGAPSPGTAPRRARQSLLYWRKNFFDPDGLFNRLEPRLRFFWTPGFLALSAAGILGAAATAWLNRQELASSFA